ncbi:MAG: chemotaxis protein CheW [Candidatus Hydrogenedentes bacterium]|nr:chemotaxis protein CheW [Candidatus Hydrogenedentota bacterium]
MDDDLLKEFINECREHLVTIETDLLALEEGGADIDEPLVNKVFRAAHSIKGGSGFFGLNNVKELSHKAETVLDMIRSRKMAPNSEVTNILLAAFDKLRELINSTETSDQADIGDLLVALTGLASSYLPPDQKASLTSFVDLPAPCASGKITLPQIDVDRARAAGLYIYWVDCDLIHDIEEKGQTVLSVFNTLTVVGDVLDCAVDFDAVGNLDGVVGNRVPLRLVVATVLEPDMAGGLFDTIEESRIHLLLDPRAPIAPAVAAPAPIVHAAPEPEAAPVVAVPAPPAPVVAAAPAAPAPRGAEAASAQSGASDETLRINVTLLEALMNLAGELVLSRNQLRAAVSNNDQQMLSSADQRINQVTSELQDVIMQTRLQPIGNVFSKFPRVVRDLSRSLGKEIDLEILGKDVALDKTMLEGLSDPLTHMVRNAVDHGIEGAAERAAAGKKAAGTVRIDARHEAGQVVVEISDDGKGLHPDAIAESAMRKGLISAEKVQGMSSQDKQALIFLPGLSTAQVISDVSGRGVGMDVVKTNLDRLGGQVEIDSVPGKGSTFRIKLPLTLAIIPSLLVSLDEERFAIPQANIEELLRLRAEEVQERIEIVGDAEVLLLRERMIPLARLSEVIGTVPTYVDPVTERAEFDRRSRLADRRSPIYGERDDRPETSETPESLRPRSEKGRRRSRASALEIAVLNTGTLTFGLVVGSFHATEEVVVKPLGRRFKALREYSGATILGDGAVALILDASGIAAKADLASVSGTARATELQAEAESQRMQDVHSFLLFQNGPSESCALPLDVVQRIERIQHDQIERLGRHRTMQYRGGSLPLVSLSDAASFTSLDEMADPVVFVSSVHGREIGLMGTMPVDVIETRVNIDQSTHRQTGIAGSAIINGKTTFVADLHELIDVLHPEWGDQSRSTRAKSVAAAVERGETILLAEDSDFFRAQVKRYLEEDGLTVLDAPDGEAAWELLMENLDSVTLVVSDIEMPRLTGLGLATRIRSDARTAGLPIIAVSSLAGEEDAARGIAAGITEYQVKLDRETLLSRVHHFMTQQRKLKTK